MPITTDSADLKKSMVEHRLFEAAELAAKQLVHAKTILTKAGLSASNDAMVVAIAQTIATNMMSAHLIKD